jgi:hypothetical protein
VCLWASIPWTISLPVERIIDVERRPIASNLYREVLTW